MASAYHNLPGQPYPKEPIPPANFYLITFIEQFCLEHEMTLQNSVDQFHADQLRLSCVFIWSTLIRCLLFPVLIWRFESPRCKHLCEAIFVLKVCCPIRSVVSWLLASYKKWKCAIASTNCRCARTAWIWGGMRWMENANKQRDEWAPWNATETRDSQPLSASAYRKARRP